MRRIDRVFLALLLASACVEAAEPLDVVPFGYIFNANRTDQNAPETRWLSGGGDHILAGVLWEEHRPVRRVEVVFDNPAPRAADVILEVTTNTPDAKQANRPTWWTRKWEQFPGTAVKSSGGRTLVYETDGQTIAGRLKQYSRQFQYEPDRQGLILIDKLRVRYAGTGSLPAVKALRALGVAGVQPMRVEIDCGKASGARLEVYNGTARWKEQLLKNGRRRITAEVRYVSDDSQEVRFRPDLNLPTGSTGLLTYHPNRTVVTVYTASGSFSFAPKDLEKDGPISVPGLGFLVSRAGGSAVVQRQAESVRERVRRMPEQSLPKVLSDHYTATRPPYPDPEGEPPMRIVVPDELAMKAWRLAFWHVKRRCYKQGDTYLMHIWPYKSLLGQESWRIVAALDLLGEHEIPRSGLEPWFANQGKYVAAGMFFDKDGALNVPGWDLNHAQGHGSMLYAMAQHYLLTGDRKWLEEHRANLEAACEWIARQRRKWTEAAGPGTWSAGLIPPCEMGDYADWRSLYQTNVFFWRGLRQAADALMDVAPQSGARYRREAEEFRQAIIKAVERSVILAPVIRVADGTYRRFIPPQPYLRGACHQIANPYSGAHAGTLVMDTDCGSAALGLGVLGPDDPVLNEFLDVLEDRLYLENWVVRKHAKERMAGRADAWFSSGGYYYQCGYSQSALAHLLRDDVPNYLRSMFNQYAADVDPEKWYQFREHPNRTGQGNGGDKTFEVAAFLERMRSMFVMEDGDRLWLARGTPREWLKQGRRIEVRNAPSALGTLEYIIESDVEHRRIRAEVEMPSRRSGGDVVLRLRHPEGAILKSVTVNGQPCTRFDTGLEAIPLAGLRGRVTVEANY